MKDKPMNNLIVHFMYKMHSRKRLRTEIGLIRSDIIKRGDRILDIGCGSGHLTIEMSKMVGEDGKVYALDIHPLAIECVNDLVQAKKIFNVETILTDKFETHLKRQSVDLVFIINTIDMIRDKKRLVDEVEKILKPNGRVIIRNKMRINFSGARLENLFINSSIKYQKTINNTYFYIKEVKNVCKHKNQ